MSFESGRSWERISFGSSLPVIPSGMGGPCRNWDGRPRGLQGVHDLQGVRDLWDPRADGHRDRPVGGRRRTSTLSPLVATGSSVIANDRRSGNRPAHHGGRPRDDRHDVVVRRLGGDRGSPTGGRHDGRRGRRPHGGGHRRPLRSGRVARSGQCDDRRHGGGHPLLRPRPESSLRRSPPGRPLPFDGAIVAVVPPAASGTVVTAALPAIVAAITTAVVAATVAARTVVTRTVVAGAIASCGALASLSASPASRSARSSASVVAARAVVRVVCLSHRHPRSSLFSSAPRCSALAPSDRAEHRHSFYRGRPRREGSRSSSSSQLVLICPQPSARRQSIPSSRSCLRFHPPAGSIPTEVSGRTPVHRISQRPRPGRSSRSPSSPPHPPPSSSTNPSCIPRPTRRSRSLRSGPMRRGRSTNPPRRSSPTTPPQTAHSSSTRSRASSM